METTLLVGDVLLVEKVQSKLGVSPNKGDIVLFPPPATLKDLMRSSGKPPNDRDLFVKRVVGKGGDGVSVSSSGSVLINGQTPVGPRRDLCEAEPLGLIRKFLPQPEGRAGGGDADAEGGAGAEPADTNRYTTVPKDSLFLMGDCSDVSVDSRVWGTLTEQEVVGRPALRVWPLGRFGPVR